MLVVNQLPLSELSKKNPCKEHNMPEWPQNLYDFAYIPQVDEKLAELASVAEPEDWTYRHTTSEYHHPILFNFLQQTYRRLSEQDKIEISDDGQFACFNSGLVTPNQEEIFALFKANRVPDQQAWVLMGYRRKGQYDLTNFARLPEMANYFDDPAVLVLDSRKEIRVNVEHIITENKERFPAPYNEMTDYQLQTFIKGAVDNAKDRVNRNYKTAVPQYYRGQVQLLLPLCLSAPGSADLALVVTRHPEFYRASTCLTLDMAYNNARQLAKPDREWLQP